MSPTPSHDRDLVAALGVGVLLVICCTLPVLLAAGALGALGGVLGSPWLLAAAGLLIVAAVVIVVARHRRAIDGGTRERGEE